MADYEGDMRYYTYEYPGEDGKPKWETYSEEEIRKDFYPEWERKMIAKFGEEHYRKTYSFEECLDDWCIINGAWEVKD